MNGWRSTPLNRTLSPARVRRRSLAVRLPLALLLAVLSLASTGFGVSAAPTTFNLSPNAAFLACFRKATNLTPTAAVTVTHGTANDTLEIVLNNFKPDLDFDLFTVQNSSLLANGNANPAFTNFGLAWYQSDIETDTNGHADVTIKTILLDQIFGFDPDASVNLAPTNTFHVGFWFNNPQDAASCGFDVTKPTPFNGEHEAGPLAMISLPNATTGKGPLSTGATMARAANAPIRTLALQRPQPAAVVGTSSVVNSIQFNLSPTAKFLPCFRQSANATPTAAVTVTRGAANDTLRIILNNFKPNLTFELFTVQRSSLLANGAADPNFTNFGLAWYQSDVPVDASGHADVTIQTILLDQIFGFDPAVKLQPTSTFHVGFWFDNPADAAPCGFTGTTPFNGEHTAGPVAMISVPKAVGGLGPLATTPDPDPPNRAVPPTSGHPTLAPPPRPGTGSSAGTPNQLPIPRS